MSVCCIALNNQFLDFDRVAHHLTNRSMMGSPSSTAAYLMAARFWDPDAEAYLRGASCNGPDKDLRWFPNAFPTIIFTLSWVRRLDKSKLQSIEG